MPKQFTRNHTNMAKGLAILLLLMYHLFENEDLVVSMEVLYAPFRLENFLMVTGFGNICVAVFVFLTSFGISAGLLSRREEVSGHFLGMAYRQAARRFGVLMGNFAVLYLSVSLVWGYKLDYQLLYGVSKQGGLLLLTDALGLSMFFGTPTLNETWWYMEIAYLLILIVPFLAWAVKRIGYPILLLAWLLPFAVTFAPDLQRYLFVAVFGVCAAYGKWPDRLLSLRAHPLAQWLAGIVILVLCVLVRQNYMVQEYYVHLADAPIALFLVYLAAALLGAVPILGRLLAFIGRHSMNMYLVHTFFYMILWRPYIYMFRHAGVSFLLLLVSSLLYSVLLEGVKRVFRKLAGKLSQKWASRH